MALSNRLTLPQCCGDLSKESNDNPLFFFLLPIFRNWIRGRGMPFIWAGKPIGFPLYIPKQAGFILAGTVGLIPDGPDASKASKELLGRFSVDYKVVPPSYVCWFINHSK